MTNRRALRALIAALTLGGMSAAAAPEPAQAQQAAKPKPRPKDLFPYWENYLRIPAAERTRFAPAYILESGDKPMTDVPVFAVDGARRVPIAIAPDGRMTPPPVEFFRSKTAVLDAPSAKGRTFKVELTLVAVMPPAREMAAPEIAATIDQANSGIRKAAGLLGMAVPRMGRVIFADAGGGEAVDAQGRRTPLPLVNGAPAFQPSAMPGAQRVVLTRAPSRILIGPPAKPSRRK